MISLLRNSGNAAVVLMSGLQIDGLPVEFYQQFWNVIGMDLQYMK